MQNRQSLNINSDINFDINSDIDSGIDSGIGEAKSSRLRLHRGQHVFQTVFLENLMNCSPGASRSRLRVGKHRLFKWLNR
jgi:hypothetical protein